MFGRAIRGTHQELGRTGGGRVGRPIDRARVLANALVTICCRVVNVRGGAVRGTHQGVWGTVVVRRQT